MHAKTCFFASYLIHHIFNFAILATLIRCMNLPLKIIGNIFWLFIERIITEQINDKK